MSPLLTPGQIHPVFINIQSFSYVIQFKCFIILSWKTQPIIYPIPVLQCCEFLKCFCIQIAQARLRDCNHDWFRFMTWLQRLSVYNGGMHSVITTILQIIGKPFLECFFVCCGSNTPSTSSPFSVSVLRQLPLLLWVLHVITPSVL